MADGGRRKKEEKPRNGGALGVLIDQGAPGRGEWRLGEVDLVRGGSTVGWRGERATLRMAGVAWRLVSASGTRVSVGKCQGAGQVALEGSPGPFGRGRAMDEVHRRRTAGGGRNRAPGGERWR